MGASRVDRGRPGSQHRLIVWVPRTQSRHATCRYSCTRPPRRSRRSGRTASGTGLSAVEFGEGGALGSLAGPIVLGDVRQRAAPVGGVRSLRRRFQHLNPAHAPAPGAGRGARQHRDRPGLQQPQSAVVVEELTPISGTPQSLGGTGRSALHRRGMFSPGWGGRWGTAGSRRRVGRR